jgi:N-acetylglucosamine-6-sulfatase
MEAARDGDHRSATRWRWITGLAAVTLTALLLVRAVAGMPCEVEVREAADRPNIVVILFDDLDVPLAELTLDELGGVTFTNSFVTSPLCCPSRISLLTGQYAHNHGVHTNFPPDGGYFRSRDTGADRCTVPVWLQQAGYTTGLIGKYINGYGYDSVKEEMPPGWSHWEALWGSTRYADYVVNVDGVLEPGNGYQTDDLRDRALAFMSGADPPFFLFLNPYAPHRPWTPPDRHAGAPVPQDYEEPDRYRMMLAARELVDDVIAATPENTYVVVTSDNGFHFGADPGKSLPWDSDTRVPMSIVGPNLAGRAEERLVANIDLAPTIAEWAGVEAPDVDGQSLVALLEGRPADWRTSLTLEIVGAWQAERTQTSLSVEWSDGRREVFTPPR